MRVTRVIRVNTRTHRTCRSVRTDSNGGKKKKEQRDVGVQQFEPVIKLREIGNKFPRAIR